VALELVVRAGSVDSAHEKRRLDFIDALRGFACLWVLLHHSFEHVPLSGQLKHLPFDLLIQFSKIGWLGVSLFLVLSGFCLYYPIVRRRGPQGAELDVKDFTKRRALRILPPYFAALVFFSAVAWSARLHGLEWIDAAAWKDVVSHALMLHNLFPSTFASINPAFWSLALEVQLYCVFPLLVWLGARKGLRAVAGTTLAVAVVWQAVAFAKYGFSRDWAANYAVAYHALPARCFEFALGMCAAAFVARPHSSHFRNAGWLVALLIGPALAFVLFVSRFGPLCDPIWGIVFASVIILLARVPQNYFLHWSSLRAMTRLGIISYSVYLIHQPLLGLLTPEQFGLEVTTRLSFFVFAGFRLALVTAIGFGFFLLLERPFISRRAKPAPAVLPLPQTR